MTTPVKVGLAIGGVAVLYLGFIRKDKNGYTAFQRLIDPTKGGTKANPRTTGEGNKDPENINATGSIRNNPSGSGLRVKWKDPFKSSAGTLSCPRGYKLVDTPDGKFCRAEVA